MKLVKEARQAHRLWSMQGIGVTSLLTLAEALGQVLPLWEGVIPAGALAGLAAFTGSVTLFLRLIQQSGLEGDG